MVIDMTHAYPPVSVYLANEARRAEDQARAARARNTRQPLTRLSGLPPHAYIIVSRPAELRAQADAYRLAVQAPRTTHGPGAATRLRHAAGELLIQAGSWLKGHAVAAGSNELTPVT
jgi:hypothetical protein